VHRHTPIPPGIAVLPVPWEKGDARRYHHHSMTTIQTTGATTTIMAMTIQTTATMMAIQTTARYVVTPSSSSRALPMNFKTWQERLASFLTMNNCVRLRLLRFLLHFLQGGGHAKPSYSTSKPTPKPSTSHARSTNATLIKQ
jgi:hypothetical protein